MAATNEFKRGDIVDVDSKDYFLKDGVISNVEKSSGLYEVKLSLNNDDKTTGIFCKASEMTLKWRFVNTWDELKEYAEANLQGKIVALGNGVWIRNYRQGEEFLVEIGRAKSDKNLIAFYSNDKRLEGGSDGYHKTLKYGYNTSAVSFKTNFKIYVIPKIDTENKQKYLNDLQEVPISVWREEIEGKPRYDPFNTEIPKCLLDPNIHESKEWEGQECRFDWKSTKDNEGKLIIHNEAFVIKQ